MSVLLFFPVSSGFLPSSYVVLIGNDTQRHAVFPSDENHSIQFNICLFIEEIFKRDKEAFEREKEIGRTLREKKERQRKNREKARETSEGEVNDSKAGKGKLTPKPRSPAQNEAEPGPSEAEETHFKTIKSVQEEELDLENRVAIRRTENKRKYREKSPNTKGFLKAQDEINNLDKDISNAARIWTEKSVQEMKANHHKISSIPFSVLEQSYRESTYDYWVDKMTSKYQGERNILRNQIRILRDVPPSSPELAVKVAKEDFPAQRPGRRHAQIPNPIKGKGKLIKRPTIETSNRRKKKEIEPETSQEWAQVKQRRKGGKKAPNLTLEIAETEGDPSSPKRKAKLPVEITRTETDGEKGDSGGPSSQNRMLRSPAKANSTETDGGRTKGNKTAPKKAAKQDMGIKNMPPLVVDKIFTFGQGIRKELERKLEKDFNVKFNDNSTTIRTSTEKDYQTMPVPQLGVSVVFQIPVGVDLWGVAGHPYCKSWVLNLPPPLGQLPLIQDLLFPGLPL
ncbi:hypothetical protein JTB14_014959 [Gonioctena quinquepunctata]|nr:hypothetical protein JTB14_014959 [Gonioctena quinquepunctata]